MKSQGTLINEFKNGATKGTASHMYIEGDVLYSYGYHFPLLVRMKHWGKHGGFLLNADRYSSSTFQHQRQCEYIATVQIPFSAMDQAGLPTRHKLSELKLIDKSEQRWDKTGRWIYDYKQVPYYWWDCKNNEPLTGTDYDLLSDEDKKHVTVHSKIHTKVISQSEYDSLSDEEKQKCKPQEERRPESCVIRLGRTYYLSSMDGNNYFISQLPRKVLTVDEAFESLKPTEINGQGYERQGEWFFVPVDVKVPKKEIRKQKYLENRNKALPKHHYARDYALIFGYKHPLVRGTVRHTQRDHPMLKLGEQWYMAIESNHKGSWGAIGNVD